MAGSLIERTLGVLEALSEDAEGLPLLVLAERLEIPKSAAHRICNELIRLEHVRQDPHSQRYQLTTRLVAMSFRYLASTGASDIIQPILDRLAQHSGELVRLSIIEGHRLTWIAKAQGARSGLRYDPDMGREAPLHCTASGHAWLADMSDEQALALVDARGMDTDHPLGPNAPRTKEALIEHLHQARQRGYSWTRDSMGPGTAAMAALVRHPLDRHPQGVLSIAGPSVRLDDARVAELAPALITAAEELSQATPTSRLFI
ncbi:IclR family transcriptional regulator [Halomonas urumqiensis]|uniref:IclR family transcriptional regulator n=1 Tax=Halomonas urumqiensis TaxID=1684789 RepID=A0A2N7UJ47_9GAMM|nr:IclR family transcriptional regulator [Halomonas urumqiensis]PMR80466.1 IclR family transcriptional regulator [Halomonas urumqiensis]PTB01689.1 IclR family transcriptional regulator [Halomonas urumqiensis]GHE22218.1 transcriptional regulator [Halomonas urumqiensis]